MQKYPDFYNSLLESASKNTAVIIETEEILSENLDANQEYKMKKY